MKVMVIGGGAREHALAWKIAQSPRVKKLFVAPGNAGTSKIAQNLPIKPTEIDSLVKTVQNFGIHLVVVGPEGPLAAGIVDKFQKVGIPAFGPTAAATRIEASKVFALELMEAYDIPHPHGEVFSTFGGATDFISTQIPPIIVKADGLAAGKGVVVAKTNQEALEAVYNFIVKRTLGDAGSQVVIQECVFGKEVSLIAFTDGKIVVPMVTACDYKRVFDGDQGPNTGGMGSYSPSEFLTEAMIQEYTQTILIPTVKAMAAEGRPFKGILYAGLMITEEGPKVLEFNARFGDPETQAVIPLLKTDLVDIILAINNGTLDQVKIEWENKSCVGVVMASEGYPGNPKTNIPIIGLDDVDPDIIIFHAGTKAEKGKILTDGGRVLTVTAIGETMAEARNKAYANVSRIHFKGCHYRKDIAERAC